jgi:hypothetical protein
VTTTAYFHRCRSRKSSARFQLRPCRGPAVVDRPQLPRLVMVYLSCHEAFRFSANAFMPSFWSSCGRALCRVVSCVA